MFEAWLETELLGTSDSRSRSDLRVSVGTTKVQLVTLSDFSMSTPEIQRVGATPSGSTMGMLAENPSAVMPSGTGPQETIAGNNEPPMNQTPDNTLSEFLQSLKGQNQLMPTNSFLRGPQGEHPSSTGSVGTPEGGITFVQNNVRYKYYQHQTNVRQEFNVLFDPLLVAQAQHAVEQSRISIISQAQIRLNQTRE